MHRLVPFTISKLYLVKSLPKNSLDLYPNVHTTFHGCESAITFVEDGTLENTATEGKDNRTE